MLKRFAPVSAPSDSHLIHVCPFCQSFLQILLLAIQTSLVLQLGCDDLEKKVRASMLKTSGTEKVGVWEWKLSPFSQVVKVLATTEQSRECDVVGSGVGGQVRV